MEISNIFSELPSFSDHYTTVTGERYFSASDHYENSQLDGQDFGPVQPDGEMPLRATDAPEAVPSELEGPRTLSNLATEVTPVRPRRPNSFLVQGSTFDELLSSQQNPSGDGDDNASDADTLLTLGSDFDIADASKVAQKILKYNIKLAAWDTLKDGNKGVYRWHAGELYKSLLAKNSSHARPLKRILDAYDMVEGIIGNKGDVLSYFEYIEKLDMIVAEVKRIPPHIEWNCLTRTVDHFRG
jgi:hypothetical protein